MAFHSVSAVGTKAFCFSVNFTPVLEEAGRRKWAPMLIVKFVVIHINLVFEQLVICCCFFCTTMSHKRWRTKEMQREESHLAELRKG